MVKEQMLRLFIALELPESVAAALADVQQTLRELELPVRWVAPASIHLTLQFLGAAAPDRVAGLLAALEAAASGVRPFTLRLEGLGAFPNQQRPRVVWAGLAGDLERLLELQRRVVSGCSALGFVPEARPFNPHLTLGRIGDNADRVATARVGRALTATRLDPAEYWEVRRVALVRSELLPSGPRYTVLGAPSLEGAGGP